MEHFRPQFETQSFGGTSHPTEVEAELFSLPRLREVFLARVTCLQPLGTSCEDFFIFQFATLISFGQLRSALLFCSPFRPLDVRP